MLMRSRLLHHLAPSLRIRHLRPAPSLRPLPTLPLASIHMATQTRKLATAATPSPIVLPGTPFSRLPPTWNHQTFDPAPPCPRPANLPPLPIPPPQNVAVFTQHIERSANDDRSYRLITLENGLQALLISDKETDKSAAAVTVRVGNLEDPLELMGLAHYVEHLSFMGSKGWSKENEYTEFLSANSGVSNAYTAGDSTNYFFDVHPPALSGALSRFSQFFSAPLFLESCCDRELNAIESEHAKNVQNDGWRMYQLDKHTADPNHPFWKFGTGNLKTLRDTPKEKGIDVRERLLEWWKEHYSANLMKLVVLGKESLDELTKLVVRDFWDVPNKNYAETIYDSRPYTKDQLGTLIYVKTVRDIRMLDITFPFQDQTHLFREKPAQFIGHFIGHEGKGSLLSYLKNKGWANALSAGPGQKSIGFEFFKVQVDLTKEGLENYLEVTKAIFDYINLLRKSTPPEWAFKEYEMLSEMGFKYMEKSAPMSYVTGMAEEMLQPYPPEWVLSGSSLLRNYEPNVINEALTHLTPENCRVTVGAKEPVDGVAFDQKETWYGTEYAIRKLDLGKVTSAAEDLSLPAPNEFIPSDLNVKDKIPVKEFTRKPICIRQTPTSRLWFKKDDRWWIPKVNCFFLLRSPSVNSAADNFVRTMLFTELVKDSLTEYSYDATLAGLTYSISAGGMGDAILFSVEGYHDKLPVLIKRIFDTFTNFTVDATRFELIKDQYVRWFENVKLEEPRTQAKSHCRGYILEAVAYKPDESLDALRDLTPDQVQTFIPHLLERMHVESIVHGNVLRDEAVAINSIVEDALRCAPLTEEELIHPRALQLPSGKSLIYREPANNPRESNSCLDYFMYAGDIKDIGINCRIMLLDQIMSEPVFQVLRTEEQLGYSVGVGRVRAIGFVGLTILVQSEKPTQYLEERVDAFLDYMKNFLEKMEEGEFENQKMSVVNRLLEEDKNMYQETARFWQQIQSGYYDFPLRQKEAEHLRTLTKKDIIDAFMTYVHHSSKTRAKISFHIQSQAFPPSELDHVKKTLSLQGMESEFETFMNGRPTMEEMRSFLLEKDGQRREEIEKLIAGLKDKYSALPELEKVEDLKEFKKTLELAPASKPVLDGKEFVPHL
ncbi:LuxS/MPP-like metallohydrolase [Atractiella rhizophila]|nr:LuxS/MPP-like metallohydrolase [Atractiella rhizophila]